MKTTASVVYGVRTMTDDFYWELIQRDGTKTYVKPDKVPTVQKRMDEGKPIHMRTGSIPSHQIVTFRISDRRIGQQALLESAAQAFHEPLPTEDGAAIQARWVKKRVSQPMYQKHYSAIPAYHKLDDESGMVWIAFRIPIHFLGDADVELCTDTDIKRVEMHI